MRELIRLISISVFAFATLWGEQAGGSGAGKLAYENHCAMCHGMTGNENPALAAGLRVKMSHLGDPAVKKKSNEELRKEILSGTGKMNPSAIPPAQVDAVIAYVRTFQSTAPKAEAVKPSPVDAKKTEASTTGHVGGHK